MDLLLGAPGGEWPDHKPYKRHAEALVWRFPTPFLTSSERLIVACLREDQASPYADGSVRHALGSVLAYTSGVLSRPVDA